MNLKNIIIIILILILVLISFLFFIKANLYYQEIKDMKGAQLKSELKYLDNFVGLAIKNNELSKKNDKLESDLKKQEVAYEIGGWKKFKITGYSINDVAQGTTDIVRVGLSLNDPAVSKLPIIAVDPDVVPLYSIVEIEGLGAFIALDTGGAIKGNHVEILFDSKYKAKQFGVREKVNVRIIN